MRANHKKEGKSLLPGVSPQGQLNSASNCPPVQPAIGIDTEGLAIELAEVTWLLDRFEQLMQT